MKSLLILCAAGCRWWWKITRNRHILICKGAAEEIIALSTQIEIQGKILPIDDSDHHTKTEKSSPGVKRTGVSG